METWRRITTWDADPALNMGLDEALLLAGPESPTLRLYTWRPDTLSLGYFQRLADVPGRERAGAVVRRITGGGAIHHVRELTFSIALPEAHPLYRGPLARSYAAVHGAIAHALAGLGLRASLRGERALASDRPGTGMCFHRSTPLDLAWDGRKGLGSAQRRAGGRVLHHGSLKIGASPLETGVATLEDVDPTLSAQTLAPLVCAALEERLGVAFADEPPGESELALARELAPRYVDPAFVGRR